MAVEDIYEPLERYKSELKELFRKNAEEAFDEIEQLSGIDIEANKKLCRQIAELEKKIDSGRSRLGWLKALRVILILVSIALIALPFCYRKLFGAAGGENAMLYVVLGALCGVGMLIYVFTGLRRKINNEQAAVDLLQAQFDEALATAWQQMDSVNSLFSWDIPVKLIQKTIPNIQFDSFFNAARLTELCDDFGYDGFLNKNASVLFAHSGEIKGNPFVIAKKRDFRMGVKTYTGYKTIYWTSYVYDKGKRRAVPRSQVLSASVTKPCPEFNENTFLLYANEAAPNLSFSRQPEGLAEDSLFVNFRKRRKRKSLERFSRDLTDDSDYTMMSNQEFEVLFETKNRDNEVEYRLLFTALAQRSIMALMNDNVDGYGDDFSVVKRKMLNVVYPSHFAQFDLDTNPKQFVGYDFENVKKRFISINENYFRSIYFAFAPLLSIPLYQQTRTRKEIYGEDLLRKSSYWEWESIANHQGEKNFAHPQSVTNNILKAKYHRRVDDDKHEITITAHGYSGTKCVDHVRVFGGDGKYHTVDVEWIRYDHVSHDSTMVISEHPDTDKTIVREEPIRNFTTHNFRRKILYNS